MFQKPFRVKTNTQLKNTERKALKSKLLQIYKMLSEKDVDNTFSNKDPLFTSKIVTHSNHTAVVYSLNKRPLFFEYNDVMYPTVYFLWHFPAILPSITTYAPVLPKLISGADLMLPGVATPNINGPAKYGRFEKGTLVSINITSNKAPLAIGLTAHCSMDMYMAAGRGKCVQILHCINDHLCQMEKGAFPLIPPELGPPDWLVKPTNTTENVVTETETKSEPEQIIDNINESIENVLSIDSTKEMDELLTYCFLKVVKYSLKKIALPILVSNFYRLHVINACPNGKNLDIKKSSYKQLNKFLNKMKNEGLINISIGSKGVETITAINSNHPLIISFTLNEDDVVHTEDLNVNNVKFNEISSYTVTTSVLPIFSDCGLRKGDILNAYDVRKIITEYIKKKKLESLENRGVIIPNKVLAAVLQTADLATWEEVLQKIFILMSSAFEHNNTELLWKGKKIQPIILSVASRKGNKKVTLIDNLELFGIQPEDFGKECQHGVGTSTSVTKPIGKKFEQLLIQGNQIAFVGTLLREKYNIPKHLIRGLELAVNYKKNSNNIRKNPRFDFNKKRKNYLQKHFMLDLDFLVNPKKYDFREYYLTDLLFSVIPEKISIIKPMEKIAWEHFKQHLDSPTKSVKKKFTFNDVIKDLDLILKPKKNNTRKRYRRCFKLAVKPKKNNAQDQNLIFTDTFKKNNLVKLYSEVLASPVKLNKNNIQKNADQSLNLPINPKKFVSSDLPEKPKTPKNVNEGLVRPKNLKKINTVKHFNQFVDIPVKSKKNIAQKYISRSVYLPVKSKKHKTQKFFKQIFYLPP